MLLVGCCSAVALGGAKKPKMVRPPNPALKLSPMAMKSGVIVTEVEGREARTRQRRQHYRPPPYTQRYKKSAFGGENPQEKPNFIIFLLLLQLPLRLSALPRPRPSSVRP